MKHSFSTNNRAKSLNSIKYAIKNPLQTLAQKNIVGLKLPNQKHDLTRPLRILLPSFFNIPKFIDKEIDFQKQFGMIIQQNNPMSAFQIERGLKKKLRDLQFLAEAMKRAKNITEQSRYYFIEGVILHNAGAFSKSIEMFEKFLKIVLFIKDDKSVELALNSIGISYMYLNKPQVAFQYHEKQQSLNQSSQTFIGKINLGLCYEMMNQKQQAYAIYSETLQIISADDKRLQLITELLRRTRPQENENYFLTENRKIASKFSVLNQNKRGKISPKNKSGYSKLYQRKVLEKESLFAKKKKQSARVNVGIFNAEENLNQYMQDLKISYTTDC